MSPCKGDTPTFVDDKGNIGSSWGPALSYWYKYGATYILLKQTQLALEKYTFKQQQVQATKYFQVQATKYDKLSLQVQCPV